MQPWYILADATPGVLYAVRKYSKDYYQHTQLWKSFDYGKNWAFSEENRGDKNYISAIVNGLIYRAGTDGTYKSDDYAITFMQIHNQKFNIKEHGLKNCEFMFIDINNFYHSSDCYENYFSLTIGEEYVSGGMSGFFPDVYRGATEGEVFVHSWFPWYIYKVSFSDDIGNTFRHVYVNEDYQWQHSLFDKNQMLFMSDREPGVFYILNLLQVEDVSPNGCHLKLCVHYYRDYGETLVDIYCHDINKDYARETCTSVNDLDLEKPTENSVLLSWSQPEAELEIEGYRVYRNHHLLTQEIITETFYVDENLQHGNYEYYVITYYIEGCISELSNSVTVQIELDSIICEAVNDLASEKCDNNCILLSWSAPESDLEIEGYNLFRNEQLINEQLIINNSYLDKNLPTGNYEYYVVTHYTTGCISDSSNHIKETIGLSIKENDYGVVIYPNPTTGELTITNYKLRITKVEVFDVYGRKLSSHHLIVSSSHHIVNIFHLQAGIYFVRIETEKGIITQKIIKY
jgi:hypothetical protein